jgi:hypothetical protein
MSRLARAKPHVMNVHLIHIEEGGQRRRERVSHRSSYVHTPVQQRMESLEGRSMHYSGCLLSNDESEPPHDRLSARPYRPRFVESRTSIRMKNQ